MCSPRSLLQFLRDLWGYWLCGGVEWVESLWFRDPELPRRGARGLRQLRGVFGCWGDVVGSRSSSMLSSLTLNSKP